MHKNIKLWTFATISQPPRMRGPRLYLENDGGKFLGQLGNTSQQSVDNLNKTLDTLKTLQTLVDKKAHKQDLTDLDNRFQTHIAWGEKLKTKVEEIENNHNLNKTEILDRLDSFHNVLMKVNTLHINDSKITLQFLEKKLTEFQTSLNDLGISSASEYNQNFEKINLINAQLKELRETSTNAASNDDIAYLEQTLLNIIEKLHKFQTVNDETVALGAIIKQLSITVSQNENTNIDQSTQLKEIKAQFASLKEKAEEIVKFSKELKETFIPKIKSTIDSIANNLQSTSDLAAKVKNLTERLDKYGSSELLANKLKELLDISVQLEKEDSNLTKKINSLKEDLKKHIAKTVDYSWRIQVNRNELIENSVKLQEFFNSFRVLNDKEHTEMLRKIEEIENSLEALNRSTNTNMLSDFNTLSDAITDLRKEMIKIKQNETIIKNNQIKCKEMENKLKKLDEDIHITKTILSEKLIIIKKIETFIKQQEIKSQEINNKLSELDYHVSSTKNTLQLKNEELQSKVDKNSSKIGGFSLKLNDTDERISKQTVLLEELEQTIDMQSAIVQEQKQKIQEQKTMLETQEEQIARQNIMLQEHTSKIEEQAKFQVKVKETLSILETYVPIEVQSRFSKI